MRYEVIMTVQNKVLFNVEAKGFQEAIQLVKDTKPEGTLMDYEVVSFDARPEPNL